MIALDFGLAFSLVPAGGGEMEHLLPEGGSCFFAKQNKQNIVKIWRASMQQDTTAHGRVSLAEHTG